MLPSSLKNWLLTKSQRVPQIINNYKFTEPERFWERKQENKQETDSTA